jgi:hypothetical protein
MSSGGDAAEAHRCRLLHTQEGDTARCAFAWRIALISRSSLKRRELKSVSKLLAVPHGKSLDCSIFEHPSNIW